MANILYRGSATPSAVNSAGGKNAALTNLEIDQNFYSLERDKLDRVLGGTVSGNVTFSSAATVQIDGNLIVNGTTTTINSTTLSVDDINVTLGDVGTPTNVTANGGGITLRGATDKTFNWLSSNLAWNSSEHLSLAAGKNLLISGATSGVLTVAVPAAAGTNTATFQAATGTVAYTADIKDGTITVNTGSGLTGSGSFTTNQSSAATITLSHADTSSVANLSSDNAGNTFIQDISLTFDTYGHVTGASVATGTVVIGDGAMTVTAGSGLTGGGQLGTANQSGASSITLSHADTSSVANLASDNAGNTFIQDISFTFDTYGHVTAASVATGTVVVGDATLTIAAGNAITLGNTSGANTFSANTSTANTITVNHADTSSVSDAANSQNVYVSGITFDTYGHVTGITRNTVAEYDTLATVTGRGAVTSTASTFSGGVLLSGSSLNLRNGTSNNGAGGLRAKITATETSSSPAGYNVSGSTADGTMFLEVEHGDVGGIAIGADGITMYNSGDRGYLLRIVQEDAWQLNGPNYIAGDPGTSVGSGSTPVRFLLTASGALSIGSSFSAGSNITSGGDITANSDIRLKTNVQTIENALNKTLQLRGVTFDKDGKHSLGVIAQEVREILPEVVLEAADEAKTLSVAYGNMVGVLIEAIKELNAKVEDLQNQLANK
jgi:hypothetical protein